MRLTLESALNYNSGKILFDICGIRVSVKDYRIISNNNKLSDVEFICYYDNGNEETYKYSQLYDGFEDLDDAEKSFVFWIRKNPDIIYFDLEMIDHLRVCYIDAFYSGFNHKLKYSAEEQLQK